jgi:flagellar motor switch protein FliN/FliY
MGDGSLSQDEIDALLQGADDIGSIADTPVMPDMSSGGGSLTQGEQNTLRDLVSSVMGNVVPSVSGLLGGKNLSITNPLIELKQSEAVRNDFPARYVQVSMDFSGALNGKNLIVFNFNDAGSIASLMMGDDAGVAPADFNDAHQSTVQEFTNLLLSSVATQFGQKLGGGINTTPAIIGIVNSGAELLLPPGEVVKVTYDLAIDGIITSKLYHIMDINVSTGMARTGGLAAGGGGGFQQQQMPQQQAPQVGISPVKFPPLDEGIAPSIVGDISLLLDVPMTMTVELGRTKKLVQEILGLGEGSIIELDKLAGEPVDLLVNGKLIAKGEVVVIDENFGVRVTDIVSPDDRLISVSNQ